MGLVFSIHKIFESVLYTQDDEDVFMEIYEEPICYNPPIFYKDFYHQPMEDDGVEIINTVYSI